MARASAIVTGAVVALLALAVIWRVPAGHADPGAAVRMVAAPTGELDVVPSGDVLTAPSMVAGGRPVTARLAVRNQTSTQLVVAVALDPATPYLDDQVMVRISEGEDVVAEAPLGLFDGSGAPVVLAPGQRRDLRVAAWIPPGATRYSGRSVEIAMRLPIVDQGARA